MADYPFVYRGNYPGSNYHYADVGTITIKVQCGSTSTTITNAGHYNSLTNAQRVTHGSGTDTKYFAMKFSSSVADCPIESLTLSAENPAAELTVSSTVDANGYYNIVPNTLADHKKYHFTITANAKGGNTLEICPNGGCSLIVGCVEALIE